MKQKPVYYYHHPKTVALICMGPSIMDYFGATLTQELTLEFADEIWALNMASNTIEHNVCFWMDDLRSQNNFKPGLIDLLRKRGKPVITTVRHPDLVPTSYDYPINEVSAHGVKVWNKPYLNNGVAMAIGYALHIGVKCLKIYGADFTYPDRDFAESGRACVESWLTLCCVKGMEIQVCPNTSLMDQVKDDGIYGYAEQPEILVDGKVYQYVPAAMKVMGKEIGKYRGGENIAHYNELGYVPEDSSGVKKDGHVQADVPRSDGGGDAARLNGAAGPPAIGAEQVPPPAIG